MKHLAKFMSDEARNLIIGTSIIIFVFRSVPNVGIGLTWFEIDILKFDQSFFSILAMLASILTMIGILIFKNFMARNSIAKIMVVLSILNAILLIPSLAIRILKIIGKNRKYYSIRGTDMYLDFLDGIYCLKIRPY